MPDGHYEDIIPHYYVLQRIKIYCRNNKVLGIFNQEIINTKIYNDGGAIDESNFYVKWDDDYNVTITISGDEQKDEIFEVKFSEDIFYEIVK